MIPGLSVCKHDTNTLSVRIQLNTVCLSPQIYIDVRCCIKIIVQFGDKLVVHAVTLHEYKQVIHTNSQDRSNIYMLCISEK